MSTQTHVKGLVRNSAVVKVALIALSLLVVLSFSFLTIAPPSADAAAPTMTIESWKAGSPNIVVAFDQGVHDGSNGSLVAADFTVGGTDGLTISSVSHNPGDDMAILIMSGNLAIGGAGEVTVDCASAAISNFASETCTTSAQDVNGVGQDSTGPSVLNVMLLSPTQIFVEFDERINFPSVSTSDFTITTANGGDTETVTGVTATPEGVEVTASGAVIAFGDTVSVQTSLQDIVGNASAGESPKIRPSVVISEVSIGTATSAKNEFIELYNFGGSAVDMTNVKLHLYNHGTTTDTNMTLNQFNTTIPANGFYLIATSFYSGTAAADATYGTSTAQLVSNGSAYLSLSASADTDIIDQVGWGTSTKSEGTALTDISAGTSVERKASIPSTATTMASGGIDVFDGNAQDSNSNTDDFVVQSTPVPQSTQSNAEFGEGFAGNSGGDTTAPTVTGSWPDAASVNFVPAQLDFVGIDFSEQMDVTTITTTTVKLTADSAPGTNLCQSVAYNADATFGAGVTCTVNPASLPLAQAAHTVTVTTGATDIASNGLASNYTVAFTPQAAGDFAFTSTEVPQVVGSFPNDFSSSYPPNGQSLSVNFNQTIDSTTLASNVTLTDLSDSSSVAINGTSLRTIVDPSDSLEVDISTATLVAGRQYRLTVGTGVTSGDGVALASAYNLTFTVAASNDSTGAVVYATNPANSATAVPVNFPIVLISVDDALDPSTVDTSSVVLSQGSDVMPTTVEYDPALREIQIISENGFEPSTVYGVAIRAAADGDAVKNISGVALQDTDGSANNSYAFSFTTGAADSTAPAPSFAVVTETEAMVTFTEMMLENDVTDLSKWTMTSDSVTQPLSALAGHTITWDESTMTATLSGFSVDAGETFALTPVSTMRDLSGNTIGSTVNLGGEVQSAATCTFCGGTDSTFSGDIWDKPPEFAAFGHMPQAGVFPMNAMAGFTSNYMIDLPISKQIRSNANSGKLVLTFPTGFDVTNAAEDSNSYANADVNGFGPGTMAINSVTANAGARTVTIDFTIATACGEANTDPCVTGSQNDFLHFDISGITNSTVPRDWESNGYTVDIKQMTGTTLVDSTTSMPFFINAAGTASLAVDITAGSETSGTMDVHVWCPSTGDMEQTINFATEGDGTAVANFTGLPDGEFCDIWTEDKYADLGGSTDNYLGIEFLPVQIDGATASNVTLTSTSSLQDVTVQLTGAGSKNVDVVAMSRTAGFAMQTATTTTGTDTVTLKLGDGDWDVNIYPALPITGSFMQPPVQDYTVSPSKIKLTVANPAVTEASGTANDGTIAFALAAASDSVTAQVVDTTGAVMSGAMVFLDSTQGGFHTGGETGANGKVTFSVNPGTYRMGAFLPGAPPSREMKVRVDASGNVYQDGSTTVTSLVSLELSKGDQAISGTVTDGTNPVQGASVFAFCTANCVGYFDAHAITGSAGTYALYVGNGTWTVDAFSPGYGNLGSTSVTVSGSDVENTDFAPDTDVTFNTISGTICKKAGGGSDCSSATGLGGIEIWAHSEAAGGGSNFTQTADDGTYTVRVPAATGYIVEPFDPFAGPLPPITAIDASGGNATGKTSTVDTPETVTLNIVDSADSAVTINDMFIEFFDDTQDMRQSIFISGSSSKTINLPDGTYDVFVHSKGTDIDASTDVTGVGVTAGVLVVDGAETVEIEVPDLQTISGQLTDGTAAVQGAYVEVADPTTGAMIGTTTDSSGNYSISIPDGTYQVTAYNPGLVLEASSVTVAGSGETKNMVGSTTDQKITGTITDPSGSAVPYAFVKGTKEGGGTVAVQADANGEYELYVEDGTWNVDAAGHGYADKGLTEIVVSGSDVSSTNIAFTAEITGLADPVTQSLTPSKGGTVRDTGTGGSGAAVTIPGNALSTSTQAGSVVVKETNNAVDTGTTDAIGNAFEVTATDNGGNLLTSGFSENVMVEQTWSVTDLTTEGYDTLAEVEDVTISYFGSSNQWVPETTVTTYLDASGDVVASPAADLSNVTNVKFATSVDHFTVFSITAPSDGVAPSAPTNISTLVGNNEITVTWDAVTTNTDLTAITDLNGYEIYRDTSSTGAFTTQLNSSDITTTSYSDTTVSIGTTYYYKVTAADTGGVESAKSASSPGAKASASGGSAGGGGGGGGGLITASTTVTVDQMGGLTGGADHSISWNTTGSSTDVDVYVSYDDGETFTLIASGQPSTSDYVWAVPNVGADKARIRIDIRNGAGVLDTNTTDAFAITQDSTKTLENVEDVAAADPVSSLFPSKEEVAQLLSGDLSIGDLVKVDSLPAVYMIGGDGKRHPFPNERIFYSWYDGFESLKTISVSKMAGLSLGESVRVRPGTWLVKITSDPKVYAVEPGGVIRWIKNELVASELYGDRWNQRIVDVASSLFEGYSLGTPIESGEEHPKGSVIRDDNGYAHYVAEDGTLRPFDDEEAVRGNKVQTRFEVKAKIGDLARKIGVVVNGLEDVLFNYQDIGR